MYAYKLSKDCVLLIIILLFFYFFSQCQKEYSEACSKLAKLQSTGAEAAKVLLSMISKAAV